MKHCIPVVIVALALVGFADSAYMTLAHYGAVGLSDATSSAACPLSGESCSVAVNSAQATIFGIPHAVLGMAYFAALAGAALWRIRAGQWFAPTEMLIFIVAGVAWSAYLTQELLFQLGVPCPYCLLAHLLNATIAMLYAFSPH